MKKLLTLILFVSISAMTFTQSYAQSNGKAAKLPEGDWVLVGPDINNQGDVYYDRDSVLIDEDTIMFTDLLVKPSGELRTMDYVIYPKKRQYGYSTVTRYDQNGKGVIQHFDYILTMSIYKKNGGMDKILQVILKNEK